MIDHSPKNVRSISDGELDVLKALWERGASKVADIRDQLNSSGRDWAYNTVQTLLSRLEQKGFVSREKFGRAYVFSAVHTRESFLDHRLNDLANRVCEGSQTPLVMALVKGSRFKREQIAELRQLLDQLEEDDDS